MDGRFSLLAQQPNSAVLQKPKRIYDQPCNYHLMQWMRTIIIKVSILLFVPFGQILQVAWNRCNMFLFRFLHSSPVVVTFHYHALTKFDSFSFPLSCHHQITACREAAAAAAASRIHLFRHNAREERGGNLLQPTNSQTKTDYVEHTLPITKFTFNKEGE